MKPDSPFPGLLTLLGLVLIILALAFCTSCATTTLYRAGKPIARFQGNMADLVFIQSPDGSITWTAKTVTHSTATLAGGRALSNLTIPAASVLTTNQFLP